MLMKGPHLTIVEVMSSTGCFFHPVLTRSSALDDRGNQEKKSPGIVPGFLATCH